MILRLRGQGQGQGWATEADVDHHVVHRKMLCTSYYTLRWPQPWQMHVVVQCGPGSILCSNSSVPH